MIHGIKILFAIVIILVTTLQLNSVYAVAPEVLQEGSLSVSPFLIEMETKPGVAVEQAIDIFNTSKEAKRLSYGIQDFVPAGEHGQVRFLPVGKVSESKYSLVDWISVQSQPEFVVPGQGKTRIKFNVATPLGAPSGSRYAGILFSFEEDGGSANIYITRKLGVLVIARNGRGQVSGAFQTDFQKMYSSLPATLVSSFVNTGNTHLAPKGEFYIYNWLGRLVKTTTINRDGNLVLPGYERKFDSSLDTWLFGRYKVEGIVYYGSDPKLESRTQQVVWFLPLERLGERFVAGLGALVLLYLILRGYNYWLLRRSERLSKINRKRIP